MTEVTRAAGVAGTFTVTFTQAPVQAPTVTVYSDPSRTVVAVASAALAATVNPQVWTAAYPATLAAGRYYLTVSAVYTVGQPAVLDADDVLVLTAPGVQVGATVQLADVKARLNKTDSSDDDELAQLIAAAEAEYAEFVGPLPGVQIETHSGPVIILRSSRASAVTAVDPYGSTVTATLGSAGIVTTGSLGPVTVTYTAGALPANHVETIIADVAGLFAATQRGGGSLAPRFPGEGYADALEPTPGRPIVLFPRIRALATPGIA